jgi:hypothetical protein
MGFNCEDIIYGGKEYREVKMGVKVKKIYYSAFPYLDTFKFYDCYKGRFSNSQNYNFDYVLVQSSGRVEREEEQEPEWEDDDEF